MCVKTRRKQTKISFRRSFRTYLREQQEEEAEKKLEPSQSRIEESQVQSVQSSSDILKGTGHPNYKHGNRTKESMATYSNKVAELDHLEAIAHSVGIMEGPKRAGRKPKIK